jgi:hypothetical protein
LFGSLSKNGGVATVELKKDKINIKYKENKGTRRRKEKVS